MKHRGLASWYGEDFHGWPTANGERFDMDALTAAHRTLPLGTMVRVTNAENGRQVLLRINDRGPYVNGRILDLSRRAALELGMLEDGISPVQIDVVGLHEANAFLAGRPGPQLFESLLVWDTVPSQSGPPVGPWARGTLIAVELPNGHGFRTLPTDILRGRRARRVADILAAEQGVDAVAELTFA
jgi:rare lipoprotein A